MVVAENDMHNEIDLQRFSQVPCTLGRAVREGTSRDSESEPTGPSSISSAIHATRNVLGHQRRRTRIGSCYQNPS